MSNFGYNPFINNLDRTSPGGSGGGNLIILKFSGIDLLQAPGIINLGNITNDFLCDTIDILNVDVIGTPADGGGGLGNIGWTAPNYYDLLYGVSGLGNFQGGNGFFLPYALGNGIGGATSFQLVPSGTDLKLNLITPASGPSTWIVDIYLKGIYV
jgi:hypothetical protein